MERLTKRMCGGWGLNDGCNLNTLDGMREVVDRLAAYEDTGLSPETVNDLLDRFTYFYCTVEGLDIVDPVHFGVFVDRVKRWAQAEKDGRLVVLPCKVGDLLYEVDLPEYGIITCKVLHVGTYNGPAAHVEGNPIVSVVSVGVEVVEGHGKGSGYAFEMEDFGEIVFLTLEEAEAALKKREEEQQWD